MAIRARAVRLLKDWFARTVGLERLLGSDAYVEHARQRGCVIGSGTRFYGEKKLDLGHAHLITIGSDCIITDEVRVLAHIKDRPILANRFDDDQIPKRSTVGAVTIGDNVFVGEKTIILPDVSIGDNVIIGASSVVTKDVPSDTIAVGAPCEAVMSLDEYRRRRLEEEESRLKTLVRLSTERGLTSHPDGLHQFVRERSPEPDVESFIQSALREK